jgi:hypothetical protein
MTTSWSRAYCQEITASPEKVWAVLADVATWKEWNAGVGAIEIEGAFASRQAGIYPQAKRGRPSDRHPDHRG